MLRLSLRQKEFRSIESLLSSPNRAIIVQRMVLWQTRNNSNLLSDVNGSDGPEAKASDDSTFPKRVDSDWKVGAQPSAAGGVENAVTNAASLGANSFAFFLKSPFLWKSPFLTEESISEFKERMKQHGYAKNLVLPICNNLIHLGNPDSVLRKDSYECFLDDLQRCEALGLELYSFRPGSTRGEMSAERNITYIAESINLAHKATRNVTIVLKNMEGVINVGSKFSDLARIITKVKDKSRIGVCFDTCSAFAAGYDIRTEEGWEATMSKFNDEIGLKYLRAMRLSDSKTAFNSKKYHRLTIGLGHLGITTFQHILKDLRTRNIPLILGTPGLKQPKVIWSKEIEVLQALSTTAIKSEADLQSLVREITSAVEEAKISQSKKQKRVMKNTALINSDSVVGESAESSRYTWDDSVPPPEPGDIEYLDDWAYRLRKDSCI